MSIVSKIDRFSNDLGFVTEYSSFNEGYNEPVVSIRYPGGTQMLEIGPLLKTESPQGV